MSQGRLVVIYGTRPEAIKLGPVVAELNRLHVPHTLLCTGQHTDLLHGTPAESDLGSSANLGLASTGNVTEWERAAIPAIQDFLESQKPVACVVVQGDTMTAKCGAIAAKALNMPLAHVEAGLRSHSPTEPMPEEENRIVIGLIADYHYAPTERAKQNLLDEGVDPKRIWVTGNSGISAIHRYSEARPATDPTREIYVTIHRRETLARGRDFLDQLIDGALRAVEGKPCGLRWICHPAFGTKLPLAWVRDIPFNAVAVTPLPYKYMVEAVASSLGVITDSGGLQEEAGYLGVPCAVMRNVSDRPESIDAGTAKLFPPTPDGMRSAIDCLVRRDLPRIPLSTFGDSQSASRIAALLSRLV